MNNLDVDEFQIELFIDGYGSSLRPPQFATRSQKAFMRIAKGLFIDLSLSPSLRS